MIVITNVIMLLLLLLPLLLLLLLLLLLILLIIIIIAIMIIIAAFAWHLCGPVQQTCAARGGGLDSDTPGAQNLRARASNYTILYYTII